MIKQIKKFQIKLTPFDATKEWSMSTTNNQDLLLMDNTSSLDEPVALEFIDYPTITGSAVLNFECDIALEQQPDDLLHTRMGLNVSGLFYPELDPVNEDKTFKRVVFSQVRTMFYNNFHDPTKTWGMDQLDFALGKTKRKISDEFRLFDFPQQVYGDRILPNTIVIHDTSLDVNYEITDDGFGNLVAGSNLFSRQQEIGEHNNWYQSGYSSVCNSYFDFGPPPDVPTFDSDLLDWVTRVRAAGSDVSLTDQEYVNTFVTTLKSNGIWSKCYRCSVILGDDLNALKEPLVRNDSVCTPVSSYYPQDFLSNYVSTDYTSMGLIGSVVVFGSAAGKRIETPLHFPLIPSASSSFSIGSYVRTTGDGMLMGQQISGDQNRGCWLYRSSGISYCQMFNGNLGPGYGVSFSDPGGVGFYLGTITTGGVSTLYKNGVSEVSGTYTSLSVPTGGVYWGAHDSYLGFGLAWAPTAASIALYWIGQYLDATEQLTLYNAVQTLQTSLGRQV